MKAMYGTCLVCGAQEIEVWRDVTGQWGRPNTLVLAGHESDSSPEMCNGSHMPASAIRLLDDPLPPPGDMEDTSCDESKDTAESLAQDHATV